MNPLFFSLLNGDPISTTTSGPTTTPTLAPSTTTTTRRPGEPTSAIFIGDSITDFFDSEGKPTWDQFYGPLGAINFGVSGDWTTNTISRIIVDGMLNGLSAQVAVLMIGTNDLSQDSPAAQVAENIQTIITLIKETNPGVKVLLLGILPRGDGWDGINHQRVRNVNGLIQVRIIRGL
jgi:lysophospholipase L1-like esterase